VFSKFLDIREKYDFIGGMRKLWKEDIGSKLEPLFPAEKGRKSRPRKDNCLMLEGML